MVFKSCCMNLDRRPCRPDGLAVQIRCRRMRWRTILVVGSDDRAIRDVVCFALTRAGFAVQQAGGDGAAGAPAVPLNRRT